MYHLRSTQRTGYLGKDAPHLLHREAASGGTNMDQEEKFDSTAASKDSFPLEKGRNSAPAEYSNPPGTSRGDCDIEELAEQDEDCGSEITAQVQDLVLEETKPGVGIDGFEGEEVGGG
jgi:hypothetical protein